jgi:hypothetical protein
MRFINMARRSGKTTLLINSAYTTGYPIIVYDKGRAAAVEKQAKSLGLDIEVYTVNEWLSGHCPCNKVFIDEAADFFGAALVGLLKAEVVACTFSIPMTEIKNKEAEK